MSDTPRPERIETIIVGAGQAGLATGYHMARRGLPFLILDGADRVGDQWRGRWDSLRLFTPAAFNGLPGMRFPSRSWHFPTKDEFADYLEEYARTFELPVRTGVRVDGLWREGDTYRLSAGDRLFEAANVVVAMANYQTPSVPAFARELDPDIRQIHSSEYLNPGQLRAGRALLVGAGNSGSEIAMDLSRTHDVWLAGRSTGEFPFRPRSWVGRIMVPLMLRLLFYRVLSVDTPIGRRARTKIVGKGGPLIRVKARDMKAAGIRRVGRITGAREGRPLLEDGTAMDVENIVWCTGFRPGFEEWIHLPIHGDHEPRHERGAIADHPGLYFTGLHFQRALSSAMVHGAGRDAAAVVESIQGRRRWAGGSNGVWGTGSSNGTEYSARSSSSRDFSRAATSA